MAGVVEQGVARWVCQWPRTGPNMGQLFWRYLFIADLDSPRHPSFMFRG